MFTQEVLNGFEMIHRAATCEISAIRSGCRAFVGVYPPWPEKRVGQWRVRRFEIPEELVDQYFGEEQLIDSQFVRVDTLEEVEKLLVSWGLDSAVFEAPWRNDWPL